MDAPQEEDGHQQREQQQQAQQEEHAQQQQHEQHQAHEQQQQRSERKRKKKWGEERVDALALLQQQQASAGAEGEHQAQQHEQQHEGEEQCSKKRRSRWEPEPPPPAAIICSSGLPMPIQLPQSLAHLIDVNPESLELNRQLNVVGGEQGEHSKVGLDATVMLCRVCRKGCTALDVAISIWNAHSARTHACAHR